ncbi:hypothetical protein SCANM63S_02430 [Streptomyces canarius]
MVVDLGFGAGLHDPSEVHHRDPVGDVPHDRQVVRDEEVGEVELALEPVEQVDDLRLDGDVERRDRLVGHDDLRAQRESAGDADALALAAGELVGVAVDVLGVEADDVQQFLALRRRSPFGAASGWISYGSPMMSPTVIRGLREVYGSWNTIWMLRRTAFRARPESLVMSSPLYRMAPAISRSRLTSISRAWTCRSPTATDVEGLPAAEGEVDAVDGPDGTDLLLEQDALGERIVLDEPADFEDRLRHRGTPSRSGRR